MIKILKIYSPSHLHQWHMHECSDVKIFQHYFGYWCANSFWQDVNFHPLLINSVQPYEEIYITKKRWKNNSKGMNHQPQEDEEKVEFFLISFRNSIIKNFTKPDHVQHMAIVNEYLCTRCSAKCQCCGRDDLGLLIAI